MKIQRYLVVTCMLTLLLLLLPLGAQAASVQATLDRSTVQLGDTVTLNLRVEGAVGGIAEPDLQGLSQDFTILGTSQNRSLSVVNGSTSSSLTIGVALRPNHVGVLQIPALDVGGMRTTPLQIEVTAPNPSAAAAMHQDVFMQAQVTPAHGYAGEQFSYVVQLYYAVNISNGALNEPKADGLDVSKLGDDLNYDAQRGGRDYHVLERRYALTPTRAGHLEIPAASFQGESSDPMDPNSFFGSSTPVSAAAPALSIDVQAAPAGWGKSTWLPARQLSLSLDGWPGAQDQVRVGQPLNLTMTLRATGLPAAALPALSMPALAGASAYPDKPQDSTRPDGPWLLGQRQQAFALVPERAGTLTIPAITVKWWNVLTNQAEVARIPEHQVTVLPAPGAVGAPPPALAPAAAVTVATSPGSAATPAAGSLPWRWIALASVGLWLLTSLAWWWLRRRRPRAGTPAPAATPAPVPPSVRARRLAFLAAARGSDVAAQVHALLAWARAERPVIRSLGDLSAALASAPQCAAIAVLQRRQYAGADVAGAPAGLAEAFKPGFAWRPVATTASESGLPPLYPFKLH